MKCTENKSRVHSSRVLEVTQLAFEEGSRWPPYNELGKDIRISRIVKVPLDMYLFLDCTVQIAYSIL